jgi:nucleoside 2-deoxyribosyltransferase
MYNKAVKIYIAYQFSGQDKNYLKDMLKQVSNKINEIGHETYIFYRDVQKWGQPIKDKKKIINLAYNAIDKCDGLLVILENNKRSEGTILEVGYAKGKGKKVFVAISKKVGKEEFLYIKGLADKVIIYSSVRELIPKLKLLS